VRCIRGRAWLLSLVFILIIIWVYLECVRPSIQLFGFGAYFLPLQNFLEGCMFSIIPMPFCSSHPLDFHDLPSCPQPLLIFCRRTFLGRKADTDAMKFVRLCEHAYEVGELPPLSLYFCSLLTVSLRFPPLPPTPRSPLFCLKIHFLYGCLCVKIVVLH